MLLSAWQFLSLPRKQDYVSCPRLERLARNGDDPQDLDVRRLLPMLLQGLVQRHSTLWGGCQFGLQVAPLGLGQLHSDSPVRLPQPVRALDRRLECRDRGFELDIW